MNKWLPPGRNQLPGFPLARILPLLLKKGHDQLTASEHEKSLFCCSYREFID